MGLIDEISPKRIHIEEKIRGIFLSICLRGQGFIAPCSFDHVQNRLQSLFFFRFSEDSVIARERRAAKPRKTRNEGGSLFRLSPSVMLTVIFKELK